MKHLLTILTLTLASAQALAQVPAKTKNKQTATAKTEVIAPQTPPKPKSFPIIDISTNEIDIAINNLKYDAVKPRITKELRQAKRRRRDTSVLEAQQQRCERGIQALKGTDHLLVVDSVVVDKRSFIKAYNISDDQGTITLSRDGRTTEYLTQLGNKLFTVEPEGETLRLFTYYVNEGHRSGKKAVEGLGVDGDINYPFLMPDGSTLYFAARSSEGLGNYDIYITRYDYDSDKYYRAETLGFPYNSYANDYMMVIDDERNIGWFASDRYQPEDKVCIYTFIPNSTRHPYDYENDPHETILTAARLTPINAFWTPENAAERKRALRAAKAITSSSKKGRDYDFTLVINDQATYHYYTDFRNNNARQQCKIWQQQLSELSTLSRQLESLRTQYANRPTKDLKSQILKLEAQYDRLYADVRASEKQTRRLEQE